MADYTVPPCNDSDDTLTDQFMMPCAPKVTDNLDTVITVLGICGLLSLMIAAGCHINLKMIARHLRRPWSILLGMACQYILLPLIAFCGPLGFSLDPNTSVAFMIGFTCPGGAISNIATLVTDGDLALSFTLTTISMALGIGFMPLNLWIYSRYWAALAVSIPYKNLLITLVASLAAAAIGYVITWRKPKAGLILSKVTGPLGFLCIMGAIIVFMTQYSGFDGMMLTASAVVPPVAAALAYIITWLSTQKSHKLAKTIAFETINQNTSTAIAFVTISYSGPLLGVLLPAAAFSGLFAICWTCMGIIVYRLAVFRQSKVDAKDGQKSMHCAAAEKYIVEGNPSISTISDGQILETTRL